MFDLLMLLYLLALMLTSPPPQLQSPQPHIEPTIPTPAANAIPETNPAPIG
jgi:hypothetical protein